jgi:superoxide dismutase, Fe-Mn family
MPLLVMDMYEHSYQTDFGAAAAKYVEAFFRNIRWKAMLARLQSTTNHDKVSPA